MTLASQASLAAWAAQWRATAAENRIHRDFEAAASRCASLPMRIRRQAATAALKAEADAIECETYATTGVRY